MLSQYSEGDKSGGFVNIRELSPCGLISIFSQAPLPGYLHPEWLCDNEGRGGAWREVTGGVALPHTHKHTHTHTHTHQKTSTYANALPLQALTQAYQYDLKHRVSYFHSYFGVVDFGLPEFRWQLVSKSYRGVLGRSASQITCRFIVGVCVRNAFVMFLLWYRLSVIHERQQSLSYFNWL